MKNLLSRIIKMFISHYSDVILALFYKNNIWILRDVCKKALNKDYLKYLYYAYLRRYNSFIGLGAEIPFPPIFPHGISGIFISNEAKLGKNIVIFHQVTIGSNTIKDSKTKGAPIIGDNCYIGCGAKIIGGIRIEENVRIGANCIVTKNIPSNAVCIMRGLDIIRKEEIDNIWIPIYN